MQKQSERTVAVNKKAYHEYFVEETFEAGVILVGSEVKSIRAGGVNLKDSFVYIRGTSARLLNTHVAPYEKGSHFNPDARRERVLLLNKNEINKLRGKVEQKGYTIIPLRMYFKDALVKIEIGLCKGKELHDKRRSLKEKDLKRDAERQIRGDY
ncbi:MAG: SsrA-binding protein SmpB [Clostridiales bacterium]|jgi:SsrA-binding protein|nr:SsrA-binding protein SmpB [Clostridiales bacterium]